MSVDPFDLGRFVAAQATIFETALAELRAGRKQTHWMWFVFPQLRGLGRSWNAGLYGIASLEEASAYIEHPVLGPRLVAAVEAASSAPASSLRSLFGSPDDMKFRSCMTLFSIAAPDDVFGGALERWGLDPDPRTIALLEIGSVRR